jgi:acyl carrier protein
VGVAETVTRIIVEELGVKPSEVRPATRLNEDLGTDSLHIVELVLDLEDAFGLEILLKEAERFVTVQDVIEYIERRTRGSIGIVLASPLSRTARRSA